jgi:hypothetical protein
METTIGQFELAVLSLEEVRVVVRGPSTAKVKGYDYERSAAGNTSITSWIATRIKPLIGDFEVVVVDGSGVVPHGRTKLSNLRDSYISEDA